MRTSTKITVAVVAVSLLLGGTAACGTGGSSAGDSVSITIRGCTPQVPLIASNTNEVCGGNVLSATEALLVHYNPDNAAPELDIAASIKTDDAINWTVTLKKGYMFQDGTEVKAYNFVDAWNWGAYGPNAQTNSSFFEAIKGFDDLQCAEDDPDCNVPPAAEKMSGLAVVDDYTFTIETVEPTSNLMVRLGYTVFAPQPDAFFSDISVGKTAFAALPITAGPYQIVENNETQIVLEKFADYSGKFPGSVGRVTFKVYNDLNAAYIDVVANNLDLTDQIPSDQLVGDVWKSDLISADGKTPRWGVKDTGVFQALTFAPAKADPQLANLKLRQAMTMAVDRDQVVEAIFNNARVPATGWVSPVVDGYKPGACPDCVFDPVKAKKLYDEAGGYQGTLNIWSNGDGAHGIWIEAVCNQLKNNLGLDCVAATTPDFKTLRDKIQARELDGLMRAGWQMDYPSIENFLAPLYQTGAASNDSDYANPEFDSLLKKAAAATTTKEANRYYQQAEALLGKDLPTMPLWYQQSQFGFSDKIKSVKMTPFSTFDLGSIVLK